MCENNITNTLASVTKRLRLIKDTIKFNYLFGPEEENIMIRLLIGRTMNSEDIM